MEPSKWLWSSSSLGAITGAVDRARSEGISASRVHLRHLNPLPRNLGDIMSKFDRVVVPELNLGQLSHILRAEYLVDVKSISKVQGRMFLISELVAGIRQYLQEA